MVCPESYRLLAYSSPKNRLIQAIYNLPLPDLTTCIHSMGGHCVGVL